MLDVNDIPRQWRSALAAVQLLAPDALMAGGCLRDREHGVKVKDINIFVPLRQALPDLARAFAQKMRDDGWQNVAFSNDKTYGEPGNAGRPLAGIVDATYPGCPTIQIVAGAWDMDRVLPEFDFGICQIGFNGKKIIRTPDYGFDKARRVFRIVPKIDDRMFVRSINRWARIKERYPDWTFDLGSRATVHSGGWVDTSSRPDHIMYGVQTYTQARRQGKTVLMDIMARSPAEVVLPKAYVEAMRKQLDDRMLRRLLDNRSPDPVVVHRSW